VVARRPSSSRKLDRLSERARTAREAALRASRPVPEEGSGQDRRRSTASGGSSASRSSLVNHPLGRRGSVLSSDSDPISGQLVSTLAMRAADIRARAMEAPFVLLLAQRSWSSAVSFVRQSRAGYLPFDMPIVVLCPKVPAQDVAEALDLEGDTNLGAVRGSASLASDLLRSGASECSTIVCVGQEAEDESYLGSELIAMLDADVVMLQRMLERVGLADKPTILEFKRAQNMQLLPRKDPSGAAREEAEVASRREAEEQPLLDSRSPSAPEKPRPLEGAAAGLGAWWRGRKAPRSSAHLAFHLDSRFASGEVFTAQPLGCLFAQAFHTPGALEVMQALIVPDETDEHAKLPWQVRLRPDQVGATYGTAFEECVGAGVLPMGLLRWADSNERPYVWTNPSSSTVLQEGDLLFVLGDRYYGSLAFEAGLLPLSGKGG